MKFVKLAAAVAALSIAGVAGAAQATVYNLSDPGGQSGLSGVFGTVEVTQTNAVLPGVNQLDFKVTLNQGLKIVDTGSHYAFSFALDGEPAVTLFAPGVFTLSHSEGGISNSPFSGFDYGINCNAACGPGSNNPITTPITFSIRGSGLTESMLGTADTHNGNTIRFAMDTFQTLNCTGSCTAAVGGGILGDVINPNSGVPETATWGMMILGFGMVGMGLRLRRKTAAA